MQDLENVPALNGWTWWIKGCMWKASHLGADLLSAPEVVAVTSTLGKWNCGVLNLSTQWRCLMTVMLTGLLKEKKAKQNKNKKWMNKHKSQKKKSENYWDRKTDSPRCFSLNYWDSLKDILTLIILNMPKGEVVFSFQFLLGKHKTLNFYITWVCVGSCVWMHLCVQAAHVCLCRQKDNLGSPSLGTVNLYSSQAGSLLGLELSK